MKKITPSITKVQHHLSSRKASCPLVPMTIAGCLTALLTLSTQAAVIVVPNFSFEANAGGDGNFVSAADDWTITGANFSAGSYNPVDAQFSGTTGGNIPSPGEGDDISLSNLSRSGTAGSAFAVFTSLNSLATVASGWIYTLTVAGGNRVSTATPDQYTIELLVDGLSAASTILDGNTIPADSFQDISTSFTATSGQAGGSLTVRLTHSTFAGTGSASGHFDNVRLTAFDQVPEPSTLVLSFIGGLLLVNYRKHWNSL